MNARDVMMKAGRQRWFDWNEREQWDTQIRRRKGLDSARGYCSFTGEDDCPLP